VATILSDLLGEWAGLVRGLSYYMPLRPQYFLTKGSSKELRAARARAKRLRLGRLHGGSAARHVVAHAGGWRGGQLPGTAC
jgi:hypothetical protein